MPTPFSFLKKVHSDCLLRVITDEHPQTIALIVSHLRPKRAAGILNGLPPERQLAVIRRIAVMQRVDLVMVKTVAKAPNKAPAHYWRTTG